MRAASFISEILDNIKDSKLDKTDREQYLLAFDNVLAGILEERHYGIA